jgi:hypothetical protein
MYIHINRHVSVDILDYVYIQIIECRAFVSTQSKSFVAHLRVP